jgi:hypothetical protein
MRRSRQSDDTFASLISLNLQNAVAVRSTFLNPDIKENLAHEHSRHWPGLSICGRPPNDRDFQRQ